MVGVLLRPWWQDSVSMGSRKDIPLRAERSKGHENSW